MIENTENKNYFINQINNKIESNEMQCTYPIALAISAVCLEIPIQSILRILLYSFSSSVVSAAIRLGIVQHLDAQKILLLLAGTINNIISKNILKKSISDIWQLVPLTEINQMKHEHNESKMFIT